MQIRRAAWTVTTAAALVTAILLLISGYSGYAGVFTAVAVSAAINLLP